MRSRVTPILVRVLAITGMLFFSGMQGHAVAQDSANLPYMNLQLSPEQRATDLVGRMTLAEKASEMQNNSAAVPRLKIPAYQWWSEALHGVINDGVTEYPEPVGLAATFDAPGIHTMAAQIGIEGRIKHVQNLREGHTGIMGGLDFWSPNLNIFRDPRSGRSWGETGSRTNSGCGTRAQGNDPKYYLAIATPKHFAVHSGPEPTRHFADVDVSKHDEVDTYEPAFRAAVIGRKSSFSDVCLQRDQRPTGLRQSIPSAGSVARQVGIPGIRRLRLRCRQGRRGEPPLSSNTGSGCSDLRPARHG